MTPAVSSERSIFSAKITIVIAIAIESSVSR